MALSLLSFQAAFKQLMVSVSQARAPLPVDNTTSPASPKVQRDVNLEATAPAHQEMESSVAAAAKPKAKRKYTRKPKTLAAIVEAIESTPKRTKKPYSEELRTECLKMMYVSGETAEPSAETTGMVEEIVRQQVIEMVSTLLLQSNNH